MKKDNQLSVHFLGAAGTVTGSKYLVDTGEYKILIDCGMFQGVKKLRELNWSNPPVDVATIDLILLTHGHLDHVGFLPRFVKFGYNNPIIGTEPTLDVATVILEDSAKIQEEEAKKANKEGYSKHEVAEPLFDSADTQRTLNLFHSVEVDTWIDLFDGIKVRFQYNGHIIGATFIELDIRGKRLVFSGDIGRVEDKLLFAPKKPEKADVLFMESTYGDRLHVQENLEEKLKDIILRTTQRGGTLIIPSFSVERVQVLMYLLGQLKESNQIPDIPMYMDSPMGNEVLDLFRKHSSWHRLSIDESITMCRAFRIVKDYRETMKIIENREPKIIIAGSGMVTGGRVLKYLQHYVSVPKTSVMLVGFQAEGTRGRKLLEGTTELKIYGSYYAVNAEIFQIQSLSGHADMNELLDWLSEIKNTPQKVFITHGEAQPADNLRLKIKDTYGWNCTIPALYDIEEI